MFIAIDRAIEEHGRDDLRDSSDTKFEGYDGNNEGKFMAFAAFTVERLDRYGHVKLAEDGYWNSHMPMRDIYGRMLGVWRGLEDRFVLKSDGLEKVLAARIHPEHHREE